MCFTRDMVVVSVTLLVILTLGKECACLVDDCNINFHIQSQAITIFKGDNGSVVCDASCFQARGDIETIWKDKHANLVTSVPGRVFSVSYNLRRMNRLVVIGASAETAGFYVCMVMLNGEVIRQRALEFVTLGINHPNIPEPEITRGPRRGDIMPDEEVIFSYRPVRSVDRELSRVVSEVLKSATQNLNKVTSNHNTKEHVGISLNRRGRASGMLLETLKGVIMKRDNILASELTRLKETVLEIPDFITETDDDIQHVDLPRIKRQAEENTISTVSSYYSTVTNADIVVPETDDSNSTFSLYVENATSPINQETDKFTDTTGSSSLTSEEYDEAIGVSANMMNDQNSSPCSKGPEEQSNFGKYGILALAISASVAVLLFYTILMIIFMPRIMARRRNKQDIEGETYRKTGMGGSDMAPLTLLDSSATAEFEPNQEKRDSIDLDKSVSASDKSDSGKKDADITVTSVNVSSFLLRQESQKRTEDERNTEPNGKDKDTSQPGSFSAPASPSDLNPVSSAVSPDKSTQRSSGLLNLILPEIGFAPSGAGDFSGTIPGSNPNLSGGLDQELPPPPPENNLP